MTSKLYPKVFGLIVAYNLFYVSLDSALTVIGVFLLVSTVDVWILPERWRLP